MKYKNTGFISFALAVFLMLTLIACSGGDNTLSLNDNTSLTNNGVDFEPSIESSHLPFGGSPSNSSFYLPTDNETQWSQNLLSLNDISYDSFVDREAFYLWLEDAEKSNYLYTPQTSIRDYPNMYSFALYFGISADALREHFKALQAYENVQCLTDDGIDIICSLDEVKITEYFISKYAIPVNGKAYPPAWLCSNSLEDWNKAGLTPEMVIEKMRLYGEFNYSDEARVLFEEKLLQFTGERVNLAN